MSDTSTTIVSVNTLTSGTFTASDSVDLSITTGTNTETFVRTETVYNTFQPSDNSAPAVFEVVTTETYSLNYYPNIIINPSNSLRFFNFIDLHWDLRETTTGPLDATRIHIFKNYDNTIPAEVYTDELGIPPYDDEWPDGTSLWFTKALPGWRSGIMKYDWHDLTPAWNKTRHNDDAPYTVGTAVNVPLRTMRPPKNADVFFKGDSSSMFVPIRNCEGLRMEIYEPILAANQPDTYGQSAKITIGNTIETREPYRAMPPQRATLVGTVNFDQAFSFDISNNWVQFVNTGTTHALWLEIIGAGAKYLQHYGTTAWIGNTPDTSLFFN